MTTAASVLAVRACLKKRMKMRHGRVSGNKQYKRYALLRPTPGRKIRLGRVTCAKKVRLSRCVRAASTRGGVSEVLHVGLSGHAEARRIGESDLLRVMLCGREAATRGGV